MVGFIRALFSDSAEIVLFHEMSSPTGLTQSSIDDQSVSLKWDTVYGAVGYRIYCAVDSGQFVLVGTTDQNSMTVDHLTQNNVYAFAVTAYRILGSTCYESNRSFFNEYWAPQLENAYWKQTSGEQIHLYWDTVDGAVQYQVWHDNVLDVSTSALECTLTIPTKSTNYYIQAERMYNGKRITSQKLGPISVVSEDFGKKVTLVSAIAVHPGSVYLAWESSNATEYEVYRGNSENGDFECITTTSDLLYYDRNTQYSSTYFYFVRAKNDKWTFHMDSNVLSVTTKEKPTYRGLLIGEVNYDEVLQGPGNDVPALSAALQQFNYKATSQMDATKDEIKLLIDITFEDATENDISLFYYSGHGVVNSGDAYAGALACVDYSYVQMSELANMLFKVPGTVIVVLDSCGSGGAIVEKAKGNGIAYSEAFNNSVISAFAQSKMARTGELRQEKFHVIIGSAYEWNLGRNYDAQHCKRIGVRLCQQDIWRNGNRGLEQ